MVSVELPKKLEIVTLITMLYLPSAPGVNSPVLPSSSMVSLLLASLLHVPTNEAVELPRYNLALPSSTQLRLTSLTPPSGPDVV